MKMTISKSSSFKRRKRVLMMMSESGRSVQSTEKGCVKISAEIDWTTDRLRSQFPRKNPMDLDQH